MVLRRAIWTLAAIVALGMPSSASAIAGTMPANDVIATPDDLQPSDATLVGLRGFGVDPNLPRATHFYQNVQWTSSAAAPNDAGDPPLTTPPNPTGAVTSSSVSYTHLTLPTKRIV